MGEGEEGRGRERKRGKEKGGEKGIAIKKKDHVPCQIGFSTRDFVKGPNTNCSELNWQ
jgi:hypothetical protein